MRAHVVFVHSQLPFTEMMAPALIRAGYKVSVFADPIPALNAMRIVQKVDILITALQFPQGRPNGISLALMTRNMRAVRILIAGPQKLAHYAVRVGEFLPIPFSAADLVEAVQRLVTSSI
jgi:DNA-binding NtrC family response regulator